MNAAVSFEKRMIAQQALLTAMSFSVLAGFAPAVLRPGEAIVFDLVVRVVAVGWIAAVVVAAVIRRRLGAVRYTLRALALGSKAIEVHEIDALRRLPSRILWIKLVVEPLAIAAIAAYRPAVIGSDVARELVALGVMTTLATSVPALGLAQKSIGRLLELAPLDIVAAHLQELGGDSSPAKQSRRNLTFAVAIPVALVAVGCALASYAHLRAITETSRESTALAIGRGVVGAGDTRDHIGQDAAIERAKKLGFIVRFTGEEKRRSLTRTKDELVLSEPLDKGSVSVAFSSGLGFEASLPLAVVALAFAFVAVLAAHSMSRLLSRDLGRAAERLRTLGTDAVLRAKDGAAGKPDARFEAVEQLARAALALTERFRVFAAAQERALEAKENALRMRGLFFASVSHDLKSPLNAILGFADSIDRSELSASQHESLDLISTRGRELVALIETILDAARVEAGQLKLARRTSEVSSWLQTATRLGRELAQESGELKLELGEDLPSTEIDPVHLPRALAVVVAHALRAPTLDGAQARVTVRASLSARERRIRIEVDHGNTTITAGELAALFARQSSSRGRGLTLGLSLARSVFELHGGSIEVHGAPNGPPVVLAYVPLSGSMPPPRSSRSSRPIGIA